MIYVFALIIIVLIYQNGKLSNPNPEVRYFITYWNDGTGEFIGISEINKKAFVRSNVEYESIIVRVSQGKKIEGNLDEDKAIYISRLLKQCKILQQ